MSRGVKMASKNSIAEKKALKLIYDAGEEGVLQSELWKLLDVSSREGSRMAKKFEEKGKVCREKVLNNGRWTYKIFSKNEPVTLDSVEGCPCLICPEVDKCFKGGSKDPTVCLDLTAWIDPRIEPTPTQ
jgi:predicted transcriptional regulator